MSLVSVSRLEMLDETSLPNPHKVLAKHHHLRGGQLGSATDELGQSSMQPLRVSLKHLLYSWLCDRFPSDQAIS